MDWPGNYVYVPMWFLLLLMVLSTGAAQYLLIGAVKWVISRDREQLKRERLVAESQTKILRVDDWKREQLSTGKEG